MRIVVVDDNAEVLTARSVWMRDGGHDVVPLGFDAALRYDEYGAADLVLVDAHDRRNDAERARDRTVAELPDTANQFLGLDVVRFIRMRHPVGTLRIVVTSTYAASSPHLALLLAQAGADQICEHVEVAEARLLLDAVLSPPPPPDLSRNPGSVAPPVVARLESIFGEGVVVGTPDLIAVVDAIDGASPTVRDQILGKAGTADGAGRHERRRVLKGLVEALHVRHSGETGDRDPELRRIRAAVTEILGRFGRRRSDKLTK